MYSRWETWLIRLFLWLAQISFVFVARFYLCVRAARMRDKWRYRKKKHRLLDTGRQPKFLVWLLYTDLRAVHNQSAPLRLNMIMWIVALFSTVSEVLLGWLPLVPGLRIVLAACTMFFGICAFIGVCMDHKRLYGSPLILYAKENSAAKWESSILDLFMLYCAYIVAQCYFRL